MLACSDRQNQDPNVTEHPSAHFPPTREGKYEVRIADNAALVASALRLRHQVFSIELGCNLDRSPRVPHLEFDAYDFKCRHLIVTDHISGETIGTCRINTLETARSVNGFYSAQEFSIEELPVDVLNEGIELGRVSIAKEHRNTKVLFLLWKALLQYSKDAGKRYFFGCCSIFTQDERIGAMAFKYLQNAGHVDASIRVLPKRNRIEFCEALSVPDIKLPSLFKLYLHLGARVCSYPVIDRDFGTIDYFVMLDTAKMTKKYTRLLS